MNARGAVRVAFPDAATAAAVARALEPENADFVAHRTEGATLVATADAPSTRSLLRTLDDYLACLAAAEGAARAAGERGDAAPP